MADRELELETSWEHQFTNPVVETKKNNYESVVHWPDVAANDPQPVCDGGRWGGREDVEYIAKELTGGLAAFRQPCQSDKCRGRLVELADDMGLEFDK